jgi:rhamnulokinase
MKLKRGAVAVDLGATSARFALGWWNEDGTLGWELVEQLQHAPREMDGRLRWDLEALLGTCQRAVLAGQSAFEECTWGIDTWGVDFAVVDERGRPLETPVCYRDRAHETAFAQLEPHRDRLYALTGIQHQPFNSVYQLAARGVKGGIRFLPDLLTDLTFGGFDGVSELTMASTSQLLNLSGEWCEDAFELIGWPAPTGPLQKPGFERGRRGSVTAIAVGSHDTASAVYGLETKPNELYLNLGTWGLVGDLRPEPNLSDPLFTNERAVGGEVRYLANVPGFYVLSRLHSELALPIPLPDWLAEIEGPPEETVDLLDSAFFNPVSMATAMRERLSQEPRDWAAVGVYSVAQTVANVVQRLKSEPPLHSWGGGRGRGKSVLKVGGGGAASPPLLKALEATTGLEIVAGPQEATLLGNLRFQLERFASG